MRVVQHNNVKTLLARCKGVLQSQEALNNNLIHLLHLIDDNSDLLKPPFLFGSVEKDGLPIGCFVHACPDGLVITDMPKAAISPLCEAITSDQTMPTRIVGEPVFTERLVQEIVRRKNWQASVSSKWKVYRLDKVNPLDSPSAGILRLGTLSDSYLVEQWGRDYADEKPSFLSVSEFLLGKLRSGEMYFWHDMNVRTMITTSGNDLNARRISSVFTPKEFRGKGYATSAVTSVSQRLLEEGAEYVVLTAGFDEPAARIYKRIGFVPVGKRQSFVLK